ncbi:MAG: hypothetical protein JXM69_07315 [Anaerolineae bacterium]|nr:hypothetical protein [Anaerolineae bacterium]
MNQTKNQPLVRASELSQYGFCHRAWWLGTVRGLHPANQETLAQGAHLHRRHANSVRTALRWRYVGLVMLGAGSFLLIIAVVFSIFS